jgi:hypothetical protein
MSQFPSPAGTYQDQFDNIAMEPVKQSGLAITALVFSLILCCPLTTLLGPILGVVALATIGSNPMRKGKGMAVVAIIIGLIASAAWGGLIVYGVRKSIEMSKAIENAPANAMNAGYAGNFLGVRSEFYGPGATATDADIAEFFDTLKSRYGNFKSVKISNQRNSNPPMGQPSISLPHDFVFDGATVAGNIDFVIMDQVTGQWIWGKIDSITIRDPALGDLSFPPSPSSKRTATTATAPGSVP